MNGLRIQLEFLRYIFEFRTAEPFLIYNFELLFFHKIFILNNLN
jgi:hypothetical protein